jgi:hypothetical protein
MLSTSFYKIIYILPSTRKIFCIAVFFHSELSNSGKGIATYILLRQGLSGKNVLPKFGELLKLQI